MRVGERKMAERVGFEPTMGLPPYTLSRRAPSASSDIAPPATEILSLGEEGCQAAFAI